MHRTNWRSAARLAATALTATAMYGVSTATAQTGAPAPTTPAATTPPTEIATTGAPIATNGTENVPNAGTNTCFARLFKPKADNVPEQMKADDEVVVQYRLRCSSPMAAYALAFNREVSGIEAELGVTYFQGNGTPKDQSFNCGGDLPGLGVSCVGVYKGGYNTIRGLVSISLTEQEVADQVSLCKLGLTASLATFTSEVNRDQFSGKAKSNPDGTSQIANFAAGPFRVTFPQCHKGAKAAAAARR